VQPKRKIWHDKMIKPRNFKEGDYALRYDSIFKDFKGKLRTKCWALTILITCYDNGSVKIKTIDEESIPVLVNGYRLNIYNKPLSKDEFIAKIKTQ
jgi:hypothetical protein